MSLSEEDMDKLINAIFAKYDVDENKSLDKQEITQLLNDSFSKIGKPEVCASQVKDIMKKYDKNKDNLISRN